MTQKQVLHKLLSNKQGVVPVSFWHHFSAASGIDLDGYQHPEIMTNNIAKTKEFVEQVQPDFVKLMSDGLFNYDFNQPVDNPTTIYDGIVPIPDNHPWLIETAKLVTGQKKVIGNRLGFYNVFSPVTLLKWALSKGPDGKHNKKTANKLLTEAIITDRVKVDHALAVITQDVIKQATVAITAGADGIYYSTQAIQDDRLDHHDFKELVEKYDRQIIRAANQLSDTNILHICGNGGAYIAYFRGIPLVIHLFIVYYGLPVLLTAILPPLFGVSTVKLQRLDPLYAIIIAYTLYTAAFMSEIIRGAYQAVDRQQLDAAQALGYTSWQTYRFIKLPQALVEALPKLLNY